MMHFERDADMKVVQVMLQRLTHLMKAAWPAVYWQPSMVHFERDADMKVVQVMLQHLTHHMKAAWPAVYWQPSMVPSWHSWNSKLPEVLPLGRCSGTSGSTPRSQVWMSCTLKLPADQEHAASVVR
jgi:hypothetical protein